MYIESLIEKIKQTQYQFEVEGKSSFIPTPDCLGDLKSEFVGRKKNDITCITGASSSSKSSLLRCIVFETALWANENNIKYKCLWFALEEKKEEIEYAILSYLLNKITGSNIRLNIQNFLGMKRFPSTDEYAIMKLVEDKFFIIMNSLQIYDNVYTSYGIYAETRKYAYSVGTFFDKDGKVLEESTRTPFDLYVPNDVDCITEVVIDHVGELEKSGEEKELRDSIATITSLVKKYITKVFNFGALIVHQQMLEMENLDHIKEKQIYPTKQGLGDNKTVARTYINMIGITNPISFGIKLVEANNSSYNLKDVGSYFRVVNVIKQRFGKVNGKACLAHDGCSSYFEPIRDFSDFQSWESKTKNFE